MKAKKVKEHKKFEIMFMYTDIEFVYLFSNYYSSKVRLIFKLLSH